MKKFSLKPLGDSCMMKTLCKGWLFIGLLMAFCLAACSDDDDNAVTPIFPEKQNLICNSNDTREFTFTANTNWSLASSAIWCKFKTDDDLGEFVLSGTAGTQTVTLVITNDNMQVGDVSVAKLELTMGGQTIVIGEVTRSKVDYELKIYDKEGNDITKDGALKVGYQEYVHFDVEANFRFAATNLPGWVELDGGSLVGPVNKKVRGGLRIIENESREKYPVLASDENVITFSDEEGRAFHSIKLVYEGMTPGVMELKRPSSNMYDWVVSLDGKSFTQGSGGVAGTGSSTTSFKNRLPFTVKTLEDKYHVVFVAKGASNNNLYVEGVDDEWVSEKWMSCEDEKKNGNISLIVDPFTPIPGYSEEKVGYVLVFSEMEYNSIKDDLENTIIDGSNLVYKYEQANLLLQFTQKEVKSSGEDENPFTAVDGQSYSPIECTSYMGEDAEKLKSEYGVTGVYEIKQPAIRSTIIKMAFSLTDAICYYLDSKEKADGVIEPAEKEITVTTEAAHGKDVFLVITDESGNKRMVVVKISNSGSGGGSKSVFTITDGMLQPVSCVAYDGSQGGADYFKNKYSVNDIFQISNVPQSIMVTLNSSNITTFKCYDLETENEMKEISDITIEDSWSGGNNYLNVWLGGDQITKSVFLVISGEDGTEQMLFIFK